MKGYQIGKIFLTSFKGSMGR